MHIKCILLSKRNKSEKYHILYYSNFMTLYNGKGKTIETVKKLVVTKDHYSPNRDNSFLIY